VAIALEKVESNSVPELKSAISNLEKICHPNDSIITVLKVRLASMVALQDD
jgi:hypothetical protein